jgi:VCBS repeat-containing protein
MLTDLFDPRWWLTTGGTVKARAAAPKSETSAELAAARAQAIDEHKHAHGDNTALSDQSTGQHDDIAADSGLGIDDDLQTRDGASAILGGATAHHPVDRLVLPRFGDGASAPAFTNISAPGGSPSTRGARFASGSMSADPLAPFLRPGSASPGRNTSQSGGGTGDSGHVVILDVTPSGQANAQVTGPHVHSFGMPYSVCGCGYYTSPTRILDLGKDSGILQADGQLPGTRLVEGPDHVSTGKAVMGASDSDPMLDRNLSFATTWPGTANWNSATAQNGTLPGGGEAGNGGTKGTGVLTGSVTTAQVTQKAATQSFAATATFAATAAATATNAIVLENQKQGNPESEWGITGAGSSNIEGFATDISVDNGNTINFKINTDSNNYRIDIYRLGYYGGLGARKVATMQHTGVQSQPNPLRDATTGAVDAGNWAVSASWAVPDDAVSGVYIAKLVRQDGTFGENQIPFIVRDDASHSDVVFQTADQTWQAYNGWGGANFYGGNGPATGQGAGRSYAVSYNRPIATRGGVGTYAGPQDYLFGAEYAGIYWLEQNGYDVSYISGVDADRYGSLLLNHKTYIDAGHDEYWSGQQRTNVEAARDAGVNLMFWSGNEVYWRTRWGNAYSADGTPYRTLISYKETWSPGASIDPSSEWTGTFRDPRLSPPAVGGGNPENSLTGQLFKVDDVGNNLQAITVTYDDANLRFWRNTSIANLQPGQTATLTKNYLGYEWDEAVDNGFDPAGLVKLSSTTVPVSSYLFDYGNTTGNAVSTHNLTLYRAPSGALVFGAGTVYWTWGLSDNHDNQATPTDSRVQQAMVNLLADMGIQPGTLQAGLIAATGSTDRTAPTSVITVPSTVAVGSSVTITGTAVDTGGGVIAGVEVSTDNGASWHPATGDENWTYSWSPQTAGTYTILSRAVDDSINLERPSAGKTVTVSGPSFTSLFLGSTPAVVNTDDQASVELGVRFQTSVAGTISGIRFYKGSQDTSTHTGSLWSSTGVQLGKLTFTNETATGWQTAYFTSPITVTPGQIYTASYHTDTGRYSSTTNYFTSDVTSGPLTAPASNNGVYRYGTGSLFPTATFQAENYWVDVVFNTGSAPANTAPTAVADSGDATEKGGIANGTGGVAATGNVLTNDTDPDSGDSKTVSAVSFGATAGTLGTALNATYGSLVLNAAGTYTYTINESNAAVQALRLSTNTLSEVFNYAMRDTAGTTASSTLTITIHGANDAPVLAAQTAAQNATVGTAFSLVLPANTFTDVDTGDTLTYSSTLADGSVLPSWLSFNAATRTFSGTPTASGTIGVRVTATDIGGLATSETFNIAVSIPGNTTPTAVADTGDATEKGGIANGSGGVAATGNVLTNDTDPDSGDTKTVSAVSFGATAGTLGAALNGTYGSLVLNAAGTYTYTINESNAAVQALRLSTNTLSEVFNYTMRDTAGATASSTLTITIHGANDAPVLAAQTAAQNATVGTAFSLVLPANTFTDVDTGDTLTYSSTLADGSALPSWLSFNAATRTFTGTPTASGTTSVRVTATDLGGLATSETFNIAVSTAPTTYSLFTAANTPAQTNLNDGSQLELGIKFQSNVAGTITGIKFYRSANDNGQNVVDLWSSTGTKLATATYSGTTGSGWQTVNFGTAVAISANTTYIASYHTTGTYVATDGYFTNSVSNGPLTAMSSALAGGNGVYAYGGSATSGIFPNSTYDSANYWADVVFKPQLAA